MNEIVISRPHLTIEAIKEHLVLPSRPPLLQRIREKLRNSLSCSREKMLNFLVVVFPVINVVKNYKKSYFLTDIFGGIIIASIVIPLGLTHSQIVNVDLQYGIYSSIYPPLIYFLIGKSHAAAFGSFAIVCIMTGTARQRIIDSLNIKFCLVDPISDYGRMGEEGICFEESDFNSHFVSSLTLLVGVIELLMAVVRFGNLSVLLSPSLISGYTTGGAFHILFSQITYIFLLPYRMEKGCSPIIYCKLKYILGGFRQLSPGPIVTSAICLVFLVLMREFVIQNERVKRLLHFRVPSELLAIVIAILIFKFTDVSAKFGIPTIDTIPQGYPGPKVPTLAFWKYLIVDAIPIAVICWSITSSIIIMFAEKKNYSVDSNTELYKYGIINIFGGFFHGLVTTAALNRSFIFESVSQTQFAGVVGALIVLLAIYFIGNIFVYLPTCVLSTICIVALHGLFRKLKELRVLWTNDRPNFVLFLGTFVSVIFSDLTIGLACGLALSMVIILYKSYSAEIQWLAPIPGTEIYTTGQNGKQTKSPPVLSLPNSICYLNISRCLKMLETHFTANPEAPPLFQKQGRVPVILDFSMVTHFDHYSLLKFEKFLLTKHRQGCPIVVAGIKGPIYGMLERDSVVKVLGQSNFVPTLYDALYLAETHLSASSL